MINLKRGFTITELVVVMGILALLISISSISVFSTISSSRQNAVREKMVSDIKSQQAKAQAGVKNGTSVVTNWGVKIEDSKYTLFAGSSYSPGAAGNVVVEADSGITFNTDSPNSQILFEMPSGEIAGLTTGTYKINIVGNGSSSSSISLNKYGKLLE